MNQRILKLRVRNFRTLTGTELPLGPLTVMVGPNAAGKSNVLHVFEFLGDVARKGFEKALADRGGFSDVAFRGGRKPLSQISIGIEGIWSEFATEEDPDRYDLTLTYRRRPEPRHLEYVLSRRERFVQHSAPGSPSVITLVSDEVQVGSPDGGEGSARRIRVDPLLSGLQTDLPTGLTGPSVNAMSDLSRHLRSVRVFDPDVRAARRPAAISPSGRFLADDGYNLADFLLGLKQHSLRFKKKREGEETPWDHLLEDVRTVIPQIQDIEILPAHDAPDRVGVELVEHGLRGRTLLRDASFGTVRLLCLLSLFHDPNPPVLTCIEEIDHGLHPHALGLLAGRLREASERSRFLVTTHSPSFVSELEPEEFVVCERSRNGASRIPALSVEEVQEIREASEGELLGELWFAGAVGGGL